jgi:hypothetical protein
MMESGGRASTSTRLGQTAKACMRSSVQSTCRVEAPSRPAVHRAAPARVRVLRPSAASLRPHTCRRPFQARHVARPCTRGAPMLVAAGARAAAGALLLWRGVLCTVRCARCGRSRQAVRCTRSTAHVGVGAMPGGTLQLRCTRACTSLYTASRCRPQGTCLDKPPPPCAAHVLAQPPRPAAPHAHQPPPPPH